MKPNTDPLGGRRPNSQAFKVFAATCGLVIVFLTSLTTLQLKLQILSPRYPVDSISHNNSHLHRSIRANSSIAVNNSIDANNTDSKYILAWTTMFESPAWYMSFGKSLFNHSGCPEKRCVFTNDREKLPRSSLLMFHARDVQRKDMPGYHHRGQVWLIHTKESPFHTFYHPPHYLNEVFNVKSSYMHSSDIWAPYNRIYQLQDALTWNLTSDLIKAKSKLVLWYVSNCGARSNRNGYVTQLKKYIAVDIFGKCGQPDPCRRNSTCVSQLKKQYKFYLAFENSRCQEYITEKFYGALDLGMVPIVLGAPMEDYQHIAPPDSYLHVDNFTSPEELAKYIQYLDHNEEAYTKYLLWQRSYRVGVQAPHRFECQLCALAHNVSPFLQKKYTTAELWVRTNLCK